LGRGTAHGQKTELDARYEEGVAWRSTVRTEDVAWRKGIRKEDKEWREVTREEDKE